MLEHICVLQRFIIRSVNGILVGVVRDRGDDALNLVMRGPSHLAQDLSLSVRTSKGMTVWNAGFVRCKIVEHTRDARQLLIQPAQSSQQHRGRGHAVEMDKCAPPVLVIGQAIGSAHRSALAVLPVDSRPSPLLVRQADATAFRGWLRVVR